MRLYHSSRWGVTGFSSESRTIFASVFGPPILRLSVCVFNSPKTLIFYSGPCVQFAPSSNFCVHFSVCSKDDEFALCSEKTRKFSSCSIWKFSSCSMFKMFNFCSCSIQLPRKSMGGFSSKKHGGGRCNSLILSIAARASHGVRTISWLLRTRDSLSRIALGYFSGNIIHVGVTWLKIRVGGIQYDWLASSNQLFKAWGTVTAGCTTVAR